MHANRHKKNVNDDFKIRLAGVSKAKKKKKEKTSNILQMHSLPSVLSNKQVASSFPEQME